MELDSLLRKQQGSWLPAIHNDEASASTSGYEFRNYSINFLLGRGIPKAV